MTVPLLVKVCTRCGQELDISMFYSRGAGRKTESEARCKKCQNAASVVWKQKPPEKMRGYRENYAAKHPGYALRNHAAYKAKPDELCGIYQRSAEKRGIKFALSFDEFMAHWGCPCFYCGDAILTVGLDRMDNNQGYHRENI